MKNFLAIDTSNFYLTVVACKDGKFYSTFVEDCAMKQSVLLMSAVDETLQKADLRLQDCDFFAAVVGAGSFTGIRIGISAVKGFALAYGKPTLPITSFDTIAYNRVGESDKSLCLVDALHGFYYACGYEGEEVVLPPAYLSETEILALAREGGFAIMSVSETPFSTEKADPVTGLINAVCALSKQGKFGELTALYIRKSSAEENASK